MFYTFMIDFAIKAWFPFLMNQSAYFLNSTSKHYIINKLDYGFIKD